MNILDVSDMARLNTPSILFFDKFLNLKIFSHDKNPFNYEIGGIYGERQIA